MTAASGLLTYRLCARGWLLRSMGRRDCRGVEIIEVSERISLRPAEPCESRANGYSRGSEGCLLLGDSLPCCVRDSFFIAERISWKMFCDRFRFENCERAKESAARQAGAVSSPCAKYV